MAGARAATGCEGLDTLLTGGVPRSSTVLVTGGPGTGKTTLARQFLINGLKNGDKAIYVVTAEPMENAKLQIEEMGCPPGKCEKIEFVDAYSWRLPKKANGEYVLNSISELNELNRLVKLLMERLDHGSSNRVVIDSLSDVLLNTEAESVYRFLQLFISQVRARQSTAMVVVEGGLHTAEQVSTLEYLCDGVVELHTQENKRQLRIKKMLMTRHPLKWMDFEIENGLVMRVSPLVEA
jgi:circadian clock protein KaiC